LLDGRTSEAAFFGRLDERDRLRRLADETLSGRPSLVVVSGPAGIGKTSLVRSAIRDLEGEISTVVTMRCSEFAASPHEPLARLSVITGGPIDGFGSYGTGDRSAPDAMLARGAERRAATALVSDVLDAVTGPTLLVIDDLHWAGSPVLDVVELLVMELTTEPSPAVMLVLVTRPLPPGHATAARLARLEREALLPRIDLAPIDEATNADLVRSRLPLASTALIGYVHRSACGNPLLALATTEFLEHRGIPQTLSAADPRAWSAHVPDSIGHDPLAGWLAGLPADLTRLCGLAAAIGGDFDLDTAELISGAGGGADRVAPEAARSALVAQLRAAVDARVLGADDRWFWFRDDAVRDHLYRTLSRADRQTVHARLAIGLLERSPGDPELAICVGRHLLASGERFDGLPEAVDALAAAARAAFAAKSWDDAGRFFEAHLSMAADCAAAGAPAGRPVPTERFELLLEVGLAHCLNAEPRGAASRLREAVTLAEELGDEERRARALVPLLRIETASTPSALSTPAAVPALDVFLDEARDPKARAVVLQARAESLITAGRVADGERDGRLALDLAVDADEREIAASADRVLGFAALMRLAPAEAIERFRRAHDVVVRSGDWFGSDTLATRLAFAHVAAGELERSQDWGERALSDAVEHRDFTNEALVNSALGIAAQLRGDFALARRHLDLGASQGRRAGCVPAQLCAASAKVLCLLGVDDRAGAARTLAAAGNPLPAVTRALWALIDGHGAEGLSDIPCGLTDPLIGAAGAALLLASRESGVDTVARIELLEEAIAQGGELPTTLPISNRRALAAALVANEEHEAALGHLEAAEQRWREEQAYTELVEVLIAAAEVNGAVGQRDRSELQASEADRLAERLGMPGARRRARQLHQLGHTTPPQQPGGVDGVILMSDVVGSTTVSSQHGDQAYYDLVMDHHHVVRKRLTDHGGVEFSEGGDSLFAWFVAPEDAIECAIAIQLDAARLRRVGRPLSIRIGVAGGQPFFSGGRPYGSVVNRAAGLTEQARPHQIIVDETMLARVGPVITDFATRSAELKGFGWHTIGVLEVSGLGITES